MTQSISDKLNFLNSDDSNSYCYNRDKRHDAMCKKHKDS